VLVRDELAMPGSGAYQYSLASNYDMVGRPPLVAVRNGISRTLVRRETLRDMLCRDES
jgi:diaminopimelate decarboxylase